MPPRPYKKKAPLLSPTSAVYFVKQKVGKHYIPCVLKVVHYNSDETHAAVALKAYGGHGAVKLFAHHTLQSKDFPLALLLERAQPGTSLKGLSLEGKDEKATEIFCMLLNKLHSTDPANVDLPNIEAWGGGFERHLKNPSKSSAKGIDVDLISDAKNVFDKLVVSQGKLCVLHGDLHHDNILLDKTRGWVAIDPKGFMGERAVDVVAYLKNPAEGDFSLGSVFEQRIAYIASTLGLDTKRIAAWTFAMTVLSCLWLCDIDDALAPDIKERFKHWLSFALFLRRYIKEFV